MTLSHSGASELSQLMEGTTAGALIPEIVRRGFQDLLEAEVSAPGLIQSSSQASLPGLSAWVEVGGIASSLCSKVPPPQPIWI
jgi:hypothetical protein